jgi:hypothetical protein
MANILLKCSVDKQQQLGEFCNSHKHDKNTTEMNKILFVHRGMVLVDNCLISRKDKRLLVEYLYNTTAQCDTNDFKLEFEIGNCIEFCWNISQGNISVKPKNSLLCCGGGAQYVNEPANHFADLVTEPEKS